MTSDRESNEHLWNMSRAKVKIQVDRWRTFMFYWTLATKYVNCRWVQWVTRCDTSNFKNLFGGEFQELAEFGKLRNFRQKRGRQKLPNLTRVNDDRIRITLFEERYKNHSARSFGYFQDRKRKYSKITTIRRGGHREYPRRWSIGNK